MAGRPSEIDELVRCLGRLPGVGAVTAERLAYHLMSVPQAEALDLAAAIHAVREHIRVCSICSNLDATDPCAICQDPERDRSRVLVVEGARDLTAFEAASWRGLYHVLRGRIAPLEGVREGDLSIPALVKRIDGGGIEEVCVATNPDLEGEATAQAIGVSLQSSGVRITRIARGIPAGAGITQVQHTILSDALEGRRELE